MKKKYDKLESDDFKTLHTLYGFQRGPLISFCSHVLCNLEFHLLSRMGYDN